MRKCFAALIALCAGLALFAVPSSAGAANVITTAPIKVRGYQMTVVATDAKKDGLSVLFTRRAKRGTQTHMFTFNRGANVTRHSINARLGRYGRINLRFGPLRNVKSRGKLPTGCKGRAARIRTGMLRGRLRFKADRNFFRTVNVRSVRGTLAQGGRLTCSSGGDGTGGDGEGDGGGFVKGQPMLSLAKQDGDAMLSMTALKGSVSVVKVESPKKSAPAHVIRSIVVSAPRSLVVGPDATATVAARPPFLAGKGQFTPTQNLGIMAYGRLGGNLAARFDSIGRQSLTGEATLLNP